MYISLQAIVATTYCFLNEPKRQSVNFCYNTAASVSSCCSRLRLELMRQVYNCSDNLSQYSPSSPPPTTSTTTSSTSLFGFTLQEIHSWHQRFKPQEEDRQTTPTVTQNLTRMLVSTFFSTFLLSYFYFQQIACYSLTRTPWKLNIYVRTKSYVYHIYGVDKNVQDLYLRLDLHPFILRQYNDLC